MIHKFILKILYLENPQKLKDNVGEICHLMVSFQYRWGDCMLLQIRFFLVKSITYQMVSKTLVIRLITLKM